MSRAVWTVLTDEQLLAQCEVDTYRASGPGGQKRNKTSSAVRLRHPPSGLVVIAEESRSQHENRARALRRLRRALYLDIRTEVDPGAVTSNVAVRPVKASDGRLIARPRDCAYLAAAAVVLDLLDALAASVADAARA